MQKCIFLIFLFLLISCKFTTDKYSEKLTLLDNLLQENPIAVLDSLKNIPIHQLNKKNKALYYLIEASAIDKSYHNLQDDSTLRVCETYFNSTKDHYNLARTQYYIAKYLYNINNPAEAYITLKKAENNLSLSHTINSRFAGLIYYQLGVIQIRQNNLEEAEQHYLKAMTLFKNANDTTSFLFSSKQLIWLNTTKKEYLKAKEILNIALETISKIHTKNNLKNTKLYATILNTQNFLYQKQGNYDSAIYIGKKCIHILEKNNIDILSNYYASLILAYQKINQPDSVRFYCNKMLQAAQQEKNLINLLKGHRILIDLEKEKHNYEEIIRLQDKYIQIKDTLNTQIKFNKIIELEKKYNFAEKDRQYLKAKNNNLWLFIIGLAIAFSATSLLLYYNWIHRKLKEKNIRLGEEINKIRWGFMLSKELISDNTNSYDELERLLARNITVIPPKLFDEFQQSLRAQKSNYSKRLFSALTNIDSTFIEQLQNRCPDLSPEEVMLASMIRHQWNTNDIAKVFRISFDALKKRKCRLKAKVFGNESSKTDLDEYLNQI